MANNLLKQQKEEINQVFIYKKLSEIAKDDSQKEKLLFISKKEQSHYDILKNITQKDLKHSKSSVIFASFIYKVFGMSFSLRRLERKECKSAEIYKGLSGIYPELSHIVEDEKENEKILADLVRNKRLDYASSVVLGMSDALVELVGAMTGFSLAFSDKNSVAIAGLVLGFSASLSMASSEFLASKEEDDDNRSPLKAGLYTGLSYFFTVVLLVSPFFIFETLKSALSAMFCMAVLVIFAYTAYTSVVKQQNFRKKFFTMFFISVSVMIISFLFSYALKEFTGIEI